MANSLSIPSSGLCNHENTQNTKRDIDPVPSMMVTIPEPHYAKVSSCRSPSPFCGFPTFVTVPLNNFAPLTALPSSTHSFPSPFICGLSYPPFTSSSDESCASSALSVPSSAGALSGLVETLDISGLGKTSETPKGYYHLFVCFLSFMEFLCQYMKSKRVKIFELLKSREKVNCLFTDYALSFNTVLNCLNFSCVL